jgi:hypothetical protein
VGDKIVYDAFFNYKEGLFWYTQIF